MIHLLVAAALAGSVGGAEPQDFSGAAPLMQGDYAAAERAIDRELRMFPGSPDLLLNLAIVYARTDRADQARRLYAQVLAQPDEMLDSGRATMSAHAIARRGLAAMAARATPGLAAVK